MDPITAFGLAASSMTFVDFGYKFIRTACEIHDSMNGSTGEMRSSAAIYKDLVEVSHRLTQTSEFSDPVLINLAEKCHETSQDLLRELGNLVVDRKDIFASARGAVRMFKKKKRIGHLQQRLGLYQQQLGLHIMTKMHEGQITKDYLDKRFDDNHRVQTSFSNALALNDKKSDQHAIALTRAYDRLATNFGSLSIQHAQMISLFRTIMPNNVLERLYFDSMSAFVDDFVDTGNDPGGSTVLYIPTDGRDVGTIHITRPVVLIQSVAQFNTCLQDSEEHLIRSQLYQIIDQRPDLSTVAFPPHRSGRYQPHRSNYSIKQLQEAFARLIEYMEHDQSTTYLRLFHVNWERCYMPRDLEIESGHEDYDDLMNAARIADINHPRRVLDVYFNHVHTKTTCGLAGSMEWVRISPSRELISWCTHSEPCGAQPATTC